MYLCGDNNSLLKPAFHVKISHVLLENDLKHGFIFLEFLDSRVEGLISINNKKNLYFRGEICMTKEDIMKTLSHYQVLRKNISILPNLKGKKSVYTDKISMSGRSAQSVSFCRDATQIHEYCCILFLDPSFLGSFDF